MAAMESPSITLTGPRQSGKTTLLRHLFPQAAYVHLEEPDVLDFCRRDPRGFLRSFPKPVILDEVQYAPLLLPYIKADIDENRERNGQYFITGSQSFRLMSEVTEVLSGRTRYYNLLPCTRGELGQSSHSVAEEIFRGFYPELHAQPALKNLDSVARWQASYIRTFVERDVRRIANVGSLVEFERFVRLLAARSGQVLNLAALGKAAGITQPTAKRWWNVLQAGFVSFPLLPSYTNFNKRLTKSPKSYYYDVGLCRYLMGLREVSQLPLNQAFGNLFETMVVADIKKEILHTDASVSLSFFRSSDGIEVDLLIDDGEITHPFEIKATATPRWDNLQSLRKWMELSKAPKAYVLCMVTKPTPLSDRITAIPWQSHRTVWQ